MAKNAETPTTSRQRAARVGQPLTPTAAAPAAAPAFARVGKKGIKVRATRMGYYGEQRRREGDVFRIKTEREFSVNWMEYVDAETREHTTTGPQALAQTQDKLRAERAGGKRAEEGEDEGQDDPLAED